MTNISKWRQTRRNPGRSPAAGVRLNRGEYRGVLATKLVGKADVEAGAFFTLFGVVTAILSLEYKIGTAAEMGPGYFPLALGAVVLTVIGLITLIGGLAYIAMKTQENVPLKPMFLIAVSLLAFAVLVVNAGLIFAVPALCLHFPARIRAFLDWPRGSPERRPAAVLLSGVCQIARHPGAHSCGVGIMDILNGIMLGMNAALLDQSGLLLLGCVCRHGHRYSAWLGSLGDNRHASAAHLLPRAGDRPDHDCRHLLRCPIRRLDHGHFGQSPWRSLRQS